MINQRPDDREFTLLVALTARPPLPAHLKTLSTIADWQIDWERFIALVERHRLAPLVVESLAPIRNRVPDSIYALLRAAALRDRGGSCKILQALISTAKVLEESGVEAVFLKGPILGVIAFNDPTIRYSKDIDVLVRQDLGEIALNALLLSGFTLVHPKSFTRMNSVSSWIKLRKDISLVHLESGSVVELHWRAHHNPYIPIYYKHDNLQYFNVGKNRFSTFNDRNLLLYLCIHGAVHSWFRLKWLADVYAILVKYKPKEIIEFYEYAFSYNLDIPVKQMLLLIYNVYGLDLPSSILMTAKSSIRVQVLTMIAIYFQRGDDPNRYFATKGLGFAGILLNRGFRYALHEFVSLIVDWTIVAKFNGKYWSYVIGFFGRPVFMLFRKISK